MIVTSSGENPNKEKIMERQLMHPSFARINDELMKRKWQHSPIKVREYFKSYSTSFLAQLVTESDEAVKQHFNRLGKPSKEIFFPTFLADYRGRFYHSRIHRPDRGDELFVVFYGVVFLYYESGRLRQHGNCPYYYKFLVPSNLGDESLQHFDQFQLEEIQYLQFLAECNEKVKAAENP